MGSVTTSSYLERAAEKQETKIKEAYKHLIGLKIESLESEGVGCRFVYGEVKLSNGDVFMYHTRWATDEEIETSEQDKEEGLTVQEHFNSDLKDQKIKRLEVGFERDTLYVYAYTSTKEEDEEFVKKKKETNPNIITAWRDNSIAIPIADIDDISHTGDFISFTYDTLLG